MTTTTTSASLEEIAAKLSEPTPDLVDRLATIDGDIMVLGAGGKMGVSLARMAADALRQLGTDRMVYAVSRFTDAVARGRLEAAGVRTISADVGDPTALADLPDVRNVVYMVGRKFGTAGNAGATWESNVLIPDAVVRHFRDARISAFSSGNVYPRVPIGSGGADEGIMPEPVGEYAQTCLGRERVLSLRAAQFGTPLAIIRLNYAVDCRYGVLTDVARAIKDGRPISRDTGAVNVIWQGDANRVALGSLALASDPPLVLNVTGPETIGIEWLARQFGDRFGVEPVFEGETTDEALLSNASRSFVEFGYPTVPLATMIEWTWRWIVGGGELLDKPTHYAETRGRY